MVNTSNLSILETALVAILKVSEHDAVVLADLLVQMAREEAEREAERMVDNHYHVIKQENRS